MNRRTLLKGTGSLAFAMFTVHGAHVVAQEEFADLTITITDDGFDLPEELTAGRYAATVINNGTMPSHCSLGLLPAGTTHDDVVADMSDETSELLPEWFLNAGYVGLPDWLRPGESATGVVDLDAGDYFMFDPFSERQGFTTVGPGDGSVASEPAFAAEIELTEMHFVLPEAGLPTGPARLKLSNIGATAHEFHVLPVPEGTTTDQLMAVFMLPEDATPPADDLVAQALMTYQPIAAISILGAGRTAWLDTDLPAGTYAVLCMLPFPDGIPHAMQGMMEIVTLA